MLRETQQLVRACIILTAICLVFLGWFMSDFFTGGPILWDAIISLTKSLCLVAFVACGGISIILFLSRKRS